MIFYALFYKNIFTNFAIGPDFVTCATFVARTGDISFVKKTNKKSCRICSISRPSKPPLTPTRINITINFQKINLRRAHNVRRLTLFADFLHARSGSAKAQNSTIISDCDFLPDSLLGGGEASKSKTKSKSTEAIIDNTFDFE
jgi:hypothetical protein